MKLVASTWQLSTTLLICAFAPALGDLIVWVALLASRWADITPAPPITLLGGLVAFLVSLPVAYTFATIPALLAGMIYCANLSAFPMLRRNLVGRAMLGFLIGGVFVDKRRLHVIAPTATIVTIAEGQPVSRQGDTGRAGRPHPAIAAKGQAIRRR